MAYVVIAPDGRTETLEAEITLTEEENGMVKIELTIEPTPTNQKFIKDINEFWVISGIKKSQYGKFYIKHLQRHGKGKWLTVTVEAVAEFIHILQTSTFDGYYTGSRTAIEYFNILSQQSGLTIRPVDFMQAFGWEKFGLGVHNIKEFNRGLNNYGYTYEVKSPNIIELHTKEGREVQYMIKNAFNSDSMKMEIDTSETFTYIQGYADFDEEGNFYEDAKLYDDYEHPVLFDLLGKWEAETYTNQKINQLSTLQRYLKDFVDNSIKYTITTNFKQLQDYPFAVPQLGDRIRVIDESININDIAKAVKIKTFYNKYNDVVDYEIDFGNLSVAQRVKASLDSVQSQMDALRDGREPVNIGMLDANVGAVIESFKESETEVRFGDYNGFKGLFLVDKNDPNQAMALFSKGIGITENAFAGGIDDNMAMTAKGLNISTVYTGTLWLENFLGIIGKDSLFEINAEQLRMALSSNPDQYMLMDINSGFTISHLPVTQIAPDGRVITKDGYMKNEFIANIQLFNTSFDGVNMFKDNEEYSVLYVIRDKYRGRFLDITGVTRLVGTYESDQCQLDIQVTLVGSVDTELFIQRETITGSAAPDDYSYRFRLDLQELYGVVPDYRDFQFYVRAKLVNSAERHVASFRINRGLFNG